MYEKAVTEHQNAASLWEDNPEFTAYLGHTYAVSGRKGDARRTIAEIKRMSERRHVSPYYIALIYTGLGEREQAFRWLEKAYQERDHELGLLKADHRLDSLRTDPRFAELERRVGLAFSIEV
jgi:Flp pilus assembly protein TadD